MTREREIDIQAVAALTIAVILVAELIFFLVKFGA